MMNTVNICLSQEFPLWFNVLRTQYSVQEDAGSIPGVDRWVKDPALSQAEAQAGSCTSMRPLGQKLPYAADVAIKKLQ